MANSFLKSDQFISNDRSVLSILSLVGGLTILGAWIVWACSARVVRYEVSDSARLEVAGAASPIQADLSGEVATSHLVLDRMVETGAVLVELDDQEQRLALQQEATHRAQLLPQLAALELQAQTEASARQTEQRVQVFAKGNAMAQRDQARTEAKAAAEEWFRARKLRAAGLISEADSQKAQAAYESKQAAAAALEQAELRLDPEGQVKATDRTAKQRQILTDMAKLRADLATSEAAILRLRYEIERRKLRAAVSGRLTECVSLHPGAHLTEGQQLGIILPAGKVQMVADFEPASAIGKLTPGQPATIRLNGFPWAQFGVLHARVAAVAGELRNGKVHVELTLVGPPNPRIPLQHGLPGIIEVETDRITPVAMLMRSAGKALGSH